jgi:hypothetical protein
VGGWLKERYIPEPFPLGFRRVNLVLAQPYAERWSSALDWFKRREGTVVLWASPSTMFSVSYESVAPDSNGSPTPTADLQRFWSVALTAGVGGIPVYFDYEGVWARWALGAEPTAYPRGLAGEGSHSLGRAELLSEDTLTSLRELVQRPFDSASAHGGRLSFSTDRLPRRQRRLLERGYVSHRVLPDFPEMAPVDGRRIQQVVFVSGKLLPKVRPAMLFEELARLSHAVPFVYAFDQERVILCALAAFAPSVRNRQTGMLSVLQGSAQDIEIVREPLDSMLTVIDHRYDRLVSATDSAGNRSR